MSSFRVIFEFDQAKSLATKLDPNRGFDFVEAQRVWLDPDAIVGPAQVKEGEERWIIIGTLDARVIAVIFVMRGENIVRIIAARPARETERKIYEEQKG